MMSNLMLIILIFFSLDFFIRLINYAATNYPYLAQLFIRALDVVTHSLKTIVAYGDRSRKYNKRTQQPSTTSGASHVTTTTSLDKASDLTTTALDNQEEKNAQL